MSSEEELVVYREGYKILWKALRDIYASGCPACKEYAANALCSLTNAAVHEKIAHAPTPPPDSL